MAIIYNVTYDQARNAPLPPLPIETQYSLKTRAASLISWNPKDRRQLPMSHFGVVFSFCARLVEYSRVHQVVRGTVHRPQREGRGSGCSHTLVRSVDSAKPGKLLVEYTMTGPPQHSARIGILSIPTAVLKMFATRYRSKNVPSMLQARSL